ncbi:PLP-dependent transferase [Rhodocollybia butyracea]|uniref:PLP-dependent transferase n=1 Tax=Rhodocollybia butyracea TaxID=206335 RepID=A0A9P5P324_9AGAR|nr:PLP-dependent transferase [Rhodocollybia butyracea]
MSPSATLSSRGQERLDRVQAYYATNLLPVQKNYDKDKNPEGLINLGTAENSLLSDKLLELINSRFKLATEHLKYRSTLLNGFTPNTTQVLPRVINEALRPFIPNSIRSEHIAIGPGIGAVLAHLLWHLCDEGDGVLLTAPFYSDYIRDIIYPARARPVIVPIPADIDSLSVEAIPYLRRHIEAQLADGQKIKVLILNNPHNPLARAYPVNTIVEYARIAEEFNLHLVADEVFANEVYSTRYTPHPTPFTSVLSFPPPPSSDALPCSSSRIHVLWSPSKDLGASGLKIGALISPEPANKPLIETIRASMSATPVSGAADAVFTAILDEENGKWYEAFLEENRRRLRESMELVAGWCEVHGLGFEHAQAGPFLLVDFDKVIRKMEVAGPKDEFMSHSLSIEDQAKLVIDLLVRGGVRLQVPSVYGDPKGTRIRVVFSHPVEIMKIALRRIETALGLPHAEV